MTVSKRALGVCLCRYLLSMAARDGAYFKWVQAIEVRPGNISDVHHVIVALRGVDDEIDERDGYWGVYVPGNSPLTYGASCRA